MRLASKHSQHPHGPDIDAMMAAMVNRLTSEFSPLQILLFGSRARGDAEVSSDIDLLVVLPDFPFSERRGSKGLCPLVFFLRICPVEGVGSQ